MAPFFDTALYLGSQPVQAVHKGDTKIWPLTSPALESVAASAVTYTGTGSAQTINVPFSDPSTSIALLFIKDITEGFNYGLDCVFDIIRGPGKFWDCGYWDFYVEAPDSPQTVTAFTGASFSIGTDSRINTPGSLYRAWSFAGANTTAVNNSGTIQSTVAASDVLSVIRYTGNGVSGATFGHGMAGTPDAVLVKRMSAGSNTFGLFGGPTLGANVNIEFAWYEPQATQSAWIQTVNSSTVSIGNSSSVNSNGAVYMAYAFRSVAGKSKVGKYTGNGSALGQYIECNFPVDFVVVKVANGFDGRWFVFNRAFESDGRLHSTFGFEPSYQYSLELDGVDVMYSIESTGFRVFNGAIDELYPESNYFNHNLSGMEYFYIAFAATVS